MGNSKEDMDVDIRALKVNKCVGPFLLTDQRIKQKKAIIFYFQCNRCRCRAENMLFFPCVKLIIA